MLLRLLKHDLRATGRTLVLLYGILLALAGAMRVMMELIDSDVGGLLVRIFFSVFDILYVVAYFAAIVGVFVVLVMRFYRNLLTDEGYLMFTLPVTTGQLIWSKLITSVFWVVVTGGVVYLSELIVSRGTDLEFVLEGSRISSFTPDGLGISVGQYVELLALIVVMIVMIVASEYLRLYASMAMGQSSGRHKKLFGVLIYFGLSLAGVILFFVVLSNILNMENLVNFMTDTTGFHIAMRSLGAISLWACAFCVLYFVLTWLFLKKRLNLQ